MFRQHDSWWSPHLNRHMQFLWFGQFGRPLILFPTSGGSVHENEDFHLVASLGDKIDRGEIQVVCVDSVDRESWYNRRAHPADRVRRHMQYDSYLRHELVPYAQHRAQRADVMVYGASFGGYHAANLAARYPEVISRAICFSGVYDIHSFLDGYWDDNCYFHCPTAYLPNVDGDQARKISSTGWVIATGEHDTLVNENRQLSGILGTKGIPHYLEIWDGAFGHDWPWWRENLRRFVS